jgi:hypothetical protein
MFAIALLGVTAVGQAGESGLCCQTHCIVPPPPPCPNCAADPCEHRLCLCVFCPAGHAQKLIDELASDDSCRRSAAARKLGCRLHADFCREPAVLDALLRALQCDPCWVVRRQAAWSLMQQNARTEPAVLALYIAARLDPHYMVRVRAAEALDILTLGKEECYKELYKAADQLIVALRSKGYRPGRDCCVITCSAVGGPAISTTLPATPGQGETPSGEPEKVPIEKLPPPK